MRVRVATLNAWALPEPFAPDLDFRMHAIGSRLDGFPADVIAFQEVWASAARDQLLEAGARAGYHHVWYMDEILGGSGLLILSRLPILESEFELFTLRGHPEEVETLEYFAGKGFVRLRIAGDDGPFTLIATHLHARYKRWVAHAFRSHRTGQVIQLASRIREIRDPLVVVGDFNFREQHAEYEVLTGLTGFRDTAAEMDQRLPSVLGNNIYRIHRKKRDKRVDYIFVREGREWAVSPLGISRVFDGELTIDGRHGEYSNHAGILAEIDMSRREVKAPFRVRRSAIELASQLLSEGRDQAQDRYLGNRATSGVGLAVAALAIGGSRGKRLSRRRFLRGGLRLTALAAMAHGVGYRAISEFAVPEEIAAFSEAEERLHRLGQSHPLDARNVEATLPS